MRGLLKENWQEDGGRTNSKGHHYWTFDYEPAFDLCEIEREIRRRLDEIEWQFVTISNAVLENGNRKWKWFGIAPILPQSVDVGFHVTRLIAIARILNEGLLPSNQERRATTFPDTERVIHVCRTLMTKADEVVGSPKSGPDVMLVSLA